VYGPDRDSADGHNPSYVDPVVARYDALDIGDRMTRIDDMWGDLQDGRGNWTVEAEIMYYFPTFAAEINGEIVGFNAMLMGHSFFRPIAEQLPFHATTADVIGHTQTVEFSGGETGAPEALWFDDGHRIAIQAVLDTGTVELFGMTYAGTYPSTLGYELWIDYALSKNPNTKFFIGAPWLDFPSVYVDAASYTAAWDYNGGWLPFIDSIRALYPGVDIFSIPYGQAAVELRTLYEAGNLPDITALTGPAATSIFTDTKGHGGNMVKDLAELIWLNAIYGVDLDTYAFDSGYTTDLKAIAKSIMDAHNPAYNIQR
jgi:hypothetical protein